MISVTTVMVMSIQRQHSCRVLADSRKFNSSTVSNSDMALESMRIMIFMISILLDGLGSLMICTHYLIILTKTKEAILYCESFRYGGKTLSTHISIILAQVSIPTKNGSNNHQPSHMSLRDQHSCAHLCP
jgi:hypothetical protein